MKKKQQGTFCLIFFVVSLGGATCQDGIASVLLPFSLDYSAIAIILSCITIAALFIRRKNATENKVEKQLRWLGLLDISGLAFEAQFLLILITVFVGWLSHGYVHVINFIFGQ